MLPGERDEPRRDVPPPERAEAFPLTLEAERFDEFPLLCLLPAALLAITHPSSVDADPSVLGYPLCMHITQFADFQMRT
jgi:hypothetical protein